MALDVHLWTPGIREFGGGIGAFSRELALALREGGHRVAVWGKQDRDGSWMEMPLRGCGNVAGSLRKSAFAARLLTGAMVGRPGLIICTHLHFAPVAMMAAHTIGIPYVAVAHGIDVHPGLSLMRRRALARARAVWPVSRWTRQRAAALGVPEPAMPIMGNTVDGSQFSIGPPSEALRQRYRIGPSEKVILTVARLDAGEGYKGYDGVVRALPSLRAAVGPVRYLVVGRGDDSSRIRGLADGLGVGDAVTLCGFVSDQELPEHYRLADAFAMPSRGEGFGIVFLEAMASGVPVLGGSEDGTVDALADGELGLLVNPTDDAVIARGLEQLLLGRGPAHWFDRAELRARCLARFGRPAFAGRVAAAIAALDLERGA